MEVDTAKEKQLKILILMINGKQQDNVFSLSSLHTSVCLSLSLSVSLSARFFHTYLHGGKEDLEHPVLKADGEFRLVGQDFYHACVQDGKELLHGPNVAHSLFRLSKPEERGKERKKKQEDNEWKDHSCQTEAHQHPWTNLYFLES